MRRNCGRVVTNSYGPAETPVVQLSIRCSGFERSLAECRYGDRSDVEDATHHCAHSSNQVAVDCRECFTTSRSRRNSIVPYGNNPETNSSSDEGIFLRSSALDHFVFSAPLSTLHSRCGKVTKTRRKKLTNHPERFKVISGMGATH